MSSSIKDDQSGSDTEASLSPSSPRGPKLIIKPPKKMSKSDMAAAELANIREEKSVAEIAHLVHISDRRKRRMRFAEGAIKRTWRRIKARDPFEQSDSESVCGLPLSVLTNTSNTAAGYSGTGHKRKQHSESESNANAAKLAAIADDPLNPVNDYGEQSLSLETAFRRANRWIQRWSGVKPSGTDLSSDGHSNNADANHLLSREEVQVEHTSDQGLVPKLEQV